MTRIMTRIMMMRMNGMKIKEPQKAESFFRNYRRDGLTDRLIKALEKSGRNKDIIPLCEHEAAATGSYKRLVDYLIKRRRFKEAEQWCCAR
jgi:uncharacterized Zn finger protein